jgi:hypothetical protein
LRTVKWGSRRGLKRYRCTDGHGFSVDYRRKPEALWKGFVAGDSLRRLAERHELTSGAVAKRLKRELALLPRNEDITQAYCLRFGGIICIDGVYVLVKGMPRKIPFIYGIDFITHDIPVGILDFAESEAAFERLFRMLKDVGYPLHAVVCDDVAALKPALHKVFPNAVIQLCHVHVLRNIREELHISPRDQTHLPFFREVQRLLALQGETNRMLRLQMLEAEFEANERYHEVLRAIRSRWDDLFRYESIRKEGVACPRTNNLIEAYNHHFKDRIDTIKGFESLSSAERFLNAWMLKRRFTPFRECGKPFEHLNGHTSFSRSRDPGLPYPDILL